MNTRIAASPSTAVAATSELPLYSVNLMRGGYLFVGLALAVVKWPLLLHASPLPLYEGVVTCLLTALSLVALAVVPGRYVRQRYVTARGDRWR